MEGKQMAGEMSQSEVTRESYPGLFDLRDELSRRGVYSEPKAFDQYQGPYLMVPSVGRVWFDGEGVGDTFLIERGSPPCNDFETDGATWVPEEKAGELPHGVYTVDDAAERIASILGR